MRGRSLLTDKQPVGDWPAVGLPLANSPSSAPHGKPHCGFGSRLIKNSTQRTWRSTVPDYSPSGDTSCAAEQHISSGPPPRTHVNSFVTTKVARLRGVTTLELAPPSYERGSSRTHLISRTFSRWAVKPDSIKIGAPEAGARVAHPIENAKRKMLGRRPGISGATSLI
jgi:hypothetical protein